LEQLIMSQIPLRSVRLNARPATTLQSFVGTAGEIFYDSTNQTLRVYPGNVAAGKILADRDWVNSAIGDIESSSLVNGARTVSLNSTGSLTIPGDIRSEGNINIDINLSDSTLRRWQFGEDGDLVLPSDGDVKNSSGQGIFAGLADVNQAVADIPEYLLKITAEDSTVLAVGRDETLQVRGTGGVTTSISTDSTGIQLVVNGFSGDYNDLTNKPTNYVIAGILEGHTVSMHCERNSVGAVGQIMSFGNGTALGKGLRMPAAGRLITATLAGTGINGELTVQAYLNGVANASYALTQTNVSAGDVGVTGDFSGSPLLFSAGDTLGWYQASLPTASSAFNVNFYVSFDPPNF
jgi:hypothetical protein